MAKLAVTTFLTPDWDAGVGPSKEHWPKITSAADPRVLSRLPRHRIEDFERRQGTRGGVTMQTNSIPNNTTSRSMAFATSRLASSGLVVGLGLCLGACGPQGGVNAGGGGVGGSSVGGAGGSSENQDASANTGPIITIPEAGTAVDVAQACVRTAAGSCCGNGILDQSEQCDDGNTTGGDGCSPRAASSPTTYVRSPVNRASPPWSAGTGR